MLSAKKHTKLLDKDKNKSKDKDKQKKPYLDKVKEASLLGINKLYIKKYIEPLEISDIEEDLILNKPLIIQILHNKTVCIANVTIIIQYLTLEELEQVYKENSFAVKTEIFNHMLLNTELEYIIPIVRKDMYKNMWFRTLLEQVIAKNKFDLFCDLHDNIEGYNYNIIITTYIVESKLSLTDKIKYFNILKPPLYNAHNLFFSKILQYNKLNNKLITDIILLAKPENNIYNIIDYIITSLYNHQFTSIITIDMMTDDIFYKLYYYQKMDHIIYYLDRKYQPSTTCLNKIINYYSSSYLNHRIFKVLEYYMLL